MTKFAPTIVLGMLENLFIREEKSISLTDLLVVRGGVKVSCGARREKAALSSGRKARPAIRSSRKQSEQSWR
jgi:hypothetical protein